MTILLTFIEADNVSESGKVPEALAQADRDPDPLGRVRKRGGRVARLANTDFTSINVGTLAQALFQATYDSQGGGPDGAAILAKSAAPKWDF